MRGLYFGGRVTRELLRDPLSYIFCLCTPMAMQLLFFLIWYNMPGAARENMTAQIIIFRDTSTRYFSGQPEMAIAPAAE